MIVNIKETLMDSDFSMCLAYLLNYETPEEPSVIITEAIDIKKKLVLTHTVAKEEKKQKEIDNMFDFNEKDEERRNAQAQKNLKKGVTQK
jgi:hypothetical protein